MAGLLTAHTTAVHYRLRAAAPLANKIRDAISPAGDSAVQANYVVAGVGLWSYLDGRRLTSGEAADSDVGIDVEITAIGTTAGVVAELMDAVRAQLLGHSLVVPGRSTTPFSTRDDVTPPDRDRATGLLFTQATFEATSSRA